MANPGRLVGMALPWQGEGFAQVGGIIEQFARGAFDDHLRTGPVVEALVDHCKSARIADTRSGLSVWPGEKGLLFCLDLPDNGAGREAARRVREGELRGVSISFFREESELAGIYPHQYKLITRARLNEISLCESPAYGWTTKFLRWQPAPERPAPARPAAVFVQRSRPGVVETTSRLPGGRLRCGEDADFAAQRARLERELMLSEYHLWLARNGG